MTKKQKVIRLINEYWRDILAEKVKAKYGDIGFETDYNFIDSNFISTWKNLGKKKNKEIQAFVSGVEEGCLGVSNLISREL